MIALAPADAVAHVRAAGLVAYPTETLYGLGADAGSEAALDRLRRFKGRAADQPISLLVESADALEKLGFEVEPAAARLLRAFWPGPLSLVLPCRRRFARGVARADGAVAVRCSSHPVAAALARELARAAVGPVTATSLNRSGEAPACLASEARAMCSGGAGAPRLVESAAGPAPSGAPSTVVELRGAEPIVHREGAVARARIAAVLEEGRAR